MHFLLEDGTGVAGANSYMTADEFKDYHQDVGTDITGLGGNHTIEKLLVKGTRYIEQRWVFHGVREFPLVQALSFPRLYLKDREGYAVTGIPDKLKWALAEYAMAASTGDLFLTPVAPDTTGQPLIRQLTKVGPLTTEKEYSSGGATETTRKYPKADHWLDEYVVPGGRTVRA